MMKRQYTKSIEYPGYNVTVCRMDKDMNLYMFAKQVREEFEAFDVEILHVLSYYNSDRDALTCPYHLLNTPGPDAHHGVEVIWKEKD